MTSSGAIETVYAGHRFRSRLEARWAVFFDTLGVDWEYEKEGYEVAGFRYLPDFYLPKFSCFAEVKGDPRWYAEDHDRMCEILDFNSPLPHFPDSATSWNQHKDFCPGLILLGAIPNIPWGRVFHPVIRHHKGLWRDLVEFRADRLTLCQSSDRMWIHYITGCETGLGGHDVTANPEYLDPSAILVPTKLADTNLMAAYTAARQARFEFGEAHQQRAH